MARSKRTFWEAKPRKPIRYGLSARIVDWRAGRSDGEHGVPQLPPMRPEEPPAPLTTPYLDPLDRRFQDSAHAENLVALRDVAAALVRRRILARDIAEREEQSRSIQKQLDAMPEIPDDSVLSQRNALEQHADPLLVRARRLREYTAVRASVQAARDQADEEVRTRQGELAEASETIAVRRRALEIRVTRMHAHAMRRRGHYLRHLMRRHPDGLALITYFELTSPHVPDWLENWPADEGSTGI
jgi:hypothetical protein